MLPFEAVRSRVRIERTTMFICNAYACDLHLKIYIFEYLFLNHRDYICLGI